MRLSVYVHIPYCLQRCRYCDFTTFEQSEIMPPQKYVDMVCAEIRSRQSFWPERELATLYFGGGTPSLLSSDLIVAICQELANVGFQRDETCETTIEINPATLTEEKLTGYLRAGFNRFSVGAQTFNDALLKMCGRKHNASDTRDTLRLLKRYQLNYSFDLLFALPGQTLQDLKLDLEDVAEFAPNHLSAYCLTVPESHPMSLGRPPEDEQVTMFDCIEDSLARNGLLKYEISNFARPGFESRHNLAYWRDISYWGIGLSSHSYARDFGNYGMRFWNPKALPEYGGQILQPDLPPAQREALAEHESLTDFCHMSLRIKLGLFEGALRAKFPRSIATVLPRLEKLVEQGLIAAIPTGWTLTQRGELLSNLVFGELTFLADALG